MAMEKALRFLADADRSLEECSLCLMCEVIVSEAQAAEHNRSIVDAKAAIGFLRDKLTNAHDEVCGHLQQAQIQFMQDRPVPSWSTGFSGNSIRPELDLATLAFRVGMDGDRSANGNDAIGTRDETAVAVIDNQDDDAATVKEGSDDGHSYAGTVVIGGLRRDSE